MAKVDIDTSSPPDIITFGTESAIGIVYDKDGEAYCIKQVRSGLGHLVDGNPTLRAAARRQQRKDEIKKRQRATIPYSYKARRIVSEYHIGRNLSVEDGPVVNMHDLIEVRWPFQKWGVLVGYDLIMEYVAGYDLGDRTLLKSLGFDQKLDLFYQTALALKFVHDRGYVHLDMKPSNIMVTKGKVKLIDFGTSAAVRSEIDSLRGTRGYMSPEQIMKGMVDESTDVFGLGVTFNVVFGGRPLQQSFSELSEEERRRMAGNTLNHDKSSLVPADEIRAVPKLEELVKRCTVPRRKDRIGSLLPVLGVLREVAADQGVTLGAAGADVE